MKTLFLTTFFFGIATMTIHAQEAHFTFKQLKDNRELRKDIEEFVEVVNTWDTSIHRTSRVYGQAVVDQAGVLINRIDANATADPSLFRKLKISVAGTIEPILLGFHTQVEMHNIPAEAAELLHDGIKSGSPYLGVLAAGLSAVGNSYSDDVNKKQIQQLDEKVSFCLSEFLDLYRSVGGLDKYIDEELEKSQNHDTDLDIYELRRYASQKDKGLTTAKTYAEYRANKLEKATLKESPETSGIVVTTNSTTEGFQHLTAGTVVKIIRNYPYNKCAIILTPGGAPSFIPRTNLTVKKPTD